MLLTRTVLRRKKNAAGVLAALVYHAPRILAQIEAFFAPLREPDQPITDLSGTLADLKKALEHVFDELERADDAHLAEVASDRRLRRLRDRLTGELHQILLHFYRSVDNDYGPGTAEETLGLGPGMRPIPDEIYDLTRRAHDRVSEPDFEIPGPILRGDGVSVDDFRNKISERLTQLGETLEELRGRRKHFELTLQAKLAAIAEFDRVYSFVAAWARAMFLAGNEPELARRIRPTIPKTANPAEDEETFEVERGLTPAPHLPDDESAPPAASAETPPPAAPPEPNPPPANP